jgi:hypothetical protein
MRLQSPGRILRVFMYRGRSGQLCAVGLLLEPWSTAVGLAELGDEVVDLGGLSASGEFVHLVETTRAFPWCCAPDSVSSSSTGNGEDGQYGEGSTSSYCLVSRSHTSLLCRVSDCGRFQVQSWAAV